MPGMIGRSEMRFVLSSAAIGLELLVLSGWAVAVVVGFAEGIQCIAVVAAGPAVGTRYTVAAKVHCQSQWVVVRDHRVAADLAGSWNTTIVRIEVGLDEHYCRHRGKNWNWNTSSTQMPAKNKRLG